MASFDYRLNPLYTIKECSSCGALYTTDYCCSNVGSVDKFVRDPNLISYDETPDSPSQTQTSSLNQRHCFHCKDLLKEHEHCKRCTCMRCGSGLSKGFCFICDSSNKNSSQRSRPKCPTCGDPVKGLYCQQCALIRKKLEEVFQDFQDTSESSNDNTNVVSVPQEPFVFNQDPDVQNISEELAEYINSPSWNRPAFYFDDDEDDTIAITPVLSTEEPVDSLKMEDEHLDTILATESDEVIKYSVEDLVQIPSESKGIPDNMCDVPFCDNSPPLDISKDQFEGFSDSNDDSTSIDDDSFSIDDIDYVEESPPDSELVSLEEVKDFHTEYGEIEDDILREKLSKINLLIAKIEAINSNPPPSSDFVTKSSSTSLNFFLEETNTFDNSLPESKTFCFNLEEKSSGSTTTRSDYSLSDYEAFYLDDDHIEEKSSGSTTTHADFSQYDLFIFDLSIDSFPPADRSDFYHKEFVDELAHIISPPEYDCFYFKSEPDPGELTSIVDSGIRENVLSTTNVNLPFEDDQSPLLAYVVWIFLPFLTYPVTPPYLLSCGDEDTIFDPWHRVYPFFYARVYSSEWNFHEIQCTDIAKITRKRSKPDKHGDETERVNKRRKGFNNAQLKVFKIQSLVKLVLTSACALGISKFPNNSNVIIPRRRSKRRTPNVDEPEIRATIVPMADNRTMEELLHAPTEGYGEAIVIPEINADHFEIKTNLLQLVQANPFHGFERENPHTHINNFKRITSTLKFRDVPNDVIKLMMFPYSLEGAARVWYDKEPPNSILTWEVLVTKFVNQFFPPSKTTHLKNEISRFTQKFEETFSEAWERFKEMLRACPHHGFLELTQIDTFYNGLNDIDQDSLNAAAGGNLLSKTTRETLNIIENKSKVHYSRNKSNVSRMNSTSRDSKTDERIDKVADQLSTLVEIVSKKVVAPAPVKAVEESCVTYGGAHAYYNCPNTDNNQSSVCATTGTYNQVALPNRETPEKVGGIDGRRDEGKRERGKGEEERGETRRRETSEWKERGNKRKGGRGGGQREKKNKIVEKWGKTRERGKRELKKGKGNKIREWRKRKMAKGDIRERGGMVRGRRRGKRREERREEEGRRLGKKRRGGGRKMEDEDGEGTRRGDRREEGGGGDGERRQHRGN
ncbi:reverse transcriptase domain-containing protein [Tanacetum coccineum]|uniref:Reverse transcriptase domain-containing protein n=1 Tax=Tanacetum coccineum TaxID=301880 RepID=A0ABQ4ZGL0_9ASTR